MQINTVYKHESWQLAFDLRQKYHRLSIAKAPLSRCHVNNRKIDGVQSWGDWDRRVSKENLVCEDASQIQSHIISAFGS